MLSARFAADPAYTLLATGRALAALGPAAGEAMMNTLPGASTVVRRHLIRAGAATNIQEIGW